MVVAVTPFLLLFAARFKKAVKTATRESGGERATSSA